MKIKTITCHDVYNYGASLQAYALQQYLKSLGHEVEIIDYKPDYQNVRYNFWYVPPYHRFYKLTQWSKVFHFLYSLRLAPITFKTVGRKNAFRYFTSKKLILTRRYHSLEELQTNAPKADAYIAGSDQIWNCNLPNGKDGAFFLDFGTPETIRLSYAASIALNLIPEECKSEMRQRLSSFQAISLREETGRKLVEELGLPAVTVIDPVFLLTNKEWNRLGGEKPIYKKPYLLVYNLFPESTNLRNAVRKIAEDRQLDVVSVNDVRVYPDATENISNAGPIEFVNLLSHADYIVADSFHATAFSVIFEKPFSIFYQNHNISRMADFLEAVGLTHCLNPSKPVTDFKWSEVRSKLGLRIEKSKKFLLDNLNA